MPKFPRRFWTLLLTASIVLGFALRVASPGAIEWKEDEQYHFSKALSIGVTEPWPWVGIPSGVYVVNPGMSVWSFAALARVTGADSPEALTRALGLFSLCGALLWMMSGLGLLGRALGPDTERERDAFLWTGALAAVNPIGLWYQRKLWPEGFFLVFGSLAWLFWRRRAQRGFSFLWGLTAALLGQIHMSGFFSAFALTVFTLFSKSTRSQTRWGAWFLGSCAGAWPLIPWIKASLNTPEHPPIAEGIVEAIQAKFWVFWASNPIGLHLGNPLGVYRGPSHWDQLSDFVRYPLIGAWPTYASGLAHAVLLILGAWLIGAWGLSLFRRAGRQPDQRTFDPIGFTINAYLIGFGLLLTATSIRIRRYYLAVSFPIDFFWMIRAVESGLSKKPAWVPRILLVMWVAQALISASFVQYVSRNGGSPQGDFGVSYEAQKK